MNLLELPTAEDDELAFCSGPAGSELEPCEEQSAWLIERPGKMSTLRLRQQRSRPRAALEMLRSNRRKAGAAQEKMWMVKQRNNVWRWRYMPPKGSEVKAFRVLTWSMIIPGIFSAVNQTRVTRQQRPLATQRHEVRPFCLLTMTIHSSFTALSLTEKLQRA